VENRSQILASTGLTMRDAAEAVLGHKKES
jgi:hypothetical protein